MTNFFKLLNKKISVHAYKYDGTLYRCFEFPKIVFVCKKYIVLDGSKTAITTKGKSNHFYHSNSSSHVFQIFFPDQWYNLLVNYAPKTNKISYYFNIMAPFVYEDETIKYIDLDLDIRIADIEKNVTIIKQLDQKEFQFHQQTMQYPPELIKKTIEANEEVIYRLQIKDFQMEFNRTIFQPNYWKKLMENIHYHHQKRNY